jgi:hypothetical protein
MKRKGQSVRDSWYDMQRWSRRELMKCIKTGIVLAVIGMTLMIVWGIAGWAHASGGQEYREVAFNVYFVIFVLGFLVGFPAYIKALQEL